MVNHLHGCQPVTEMPLIRELLFALSEMSSPRLLMPPLYIEVVARRGGEGGRRGPELSLICMTSSECSVIGIKACIVYTQPILTDVQCLFY